LAGSLLERQGSAARHALSSATRCDVLLPDNLDNFIRKVPNELVPLDGGLR